MIQDPTTGARVPPRIVVRGVQPDPLPPGSHLWLLVIAQVDGSRWYACPREIVARSNGTWECELTLGGPAGIRHELRLGVVGPATHQAFLRHVTERPSEPLPGLPADFRATSSVVVVRA